MSTNLSDLHAQKRLLDSFKVARFNSAKVELYVAMRKDDKQTLFCNQPTVIMKNILNRFGACQCYAVTKIGTVRLVNSCAYENLITYNNYVKSIPNKCTNSSHCYNINNMKKSKIITLTLQQAKTMYGKNPEVDMLLLANFAKEELTKPALPTKWEDLEVINGYLVGAVIALSYHQKQVFSKRLFAAKKQAESAKAMAQLSQLMAIYNDGWEPDWTDDSIQAKYTISRYNKRLIIGTRCRNDYTFLAFKTAGLRDKFLESFRDLINQYFMI